MQHNLVKEMVESVLRDHHKHEWSIQGLGMLRTYLSASLRLHVWNEEARVAGASTMHTHPWDFTSYVVVGRMIDSVFQKARSGTLDGGEVFNHQMLRCGVGGGLVGSPDKVLLKSVGEGQHTAGLSYHRFASDIHSSAFDNGTVTLVKRVFKSDTEHAHVYWKGPAEWGSAEPRRATLEEVSAIVGFSFSKYFGDVT